MNPTTFTRIRLERDGAVARLTLARPDVRNAFDDVLIGELGEACVSLRAEAEAGADAAPRALVITGEGTAFCAGADMNWMKRSVAFTREQNEADARRFAGMMRGLDELPIPTIARVNGACLGGGMGLISCCDMVAAVEGADFGFTEVRLGIAPAVISPFVLAKIAAHARRYFTTGERFGAETALRIGLVDEVADDVAGAVARIVADVLRSGPAAVRAAKRLVLEPLRDGEQLARVAAGLRGGEEGQEGLRAFLEKREPTWRG
jgi:methylglutaconyl-CoA hydratase